MRRNTFFKVIILCCYTFISIISCSTGIYADEIPVETPVTISGSGEYIEDDYAVYHLHFEKGSNDKEMFDLPGFIQFDVVSFDTYTVSEGMLTVDFTSTESLDIDIQGKVINNDETVWAVTDDCIISLEGLQTEEDEQIPIVDEDIYVNPDYPDTVISKPFLLQAQPDVSDEIEYTTIEEAGLYLRDQMKQRNASVTFRFSTTSTDYRGLLRSIYEYAYMHTGVPDEGDYLYFQYGGYYCKITGYVSQGISHVVYTNTITYYSDASQEEIVNADVAQVLQELDLGNCSDYEKIKRIHDYVSQNVDYASGLPDTDYSKYTAYGALENGQAVCQGYSVLFYRLCLEADIDARVISGTGNGISHSWNIVLLDGEYYNIDTTWDHNSGDLFFLKNDTDFHGHIRNEKYASEAFYQQYPMAFISYDINEHYRIIIPESLELYPETTETIEVTFEPDKPDREIELTWSSEDESICKIENGTLQAVSPGETIIHVKAENGSEASCIVKVNDFESFVVSGEPSDIIYDGQEHKWLPVVIDESGNELVEGEHYTLTYNSEDFINTGTIEVTILGIGIYRKELTFSYSILPATLIITTESANKKYDGKPLMCPEGHVEGLVNQETLTLVVNGTITEVGTAPNTYLIKWEGTAKESNYQIEENLGVLTVEKTSVTPSTGISMNKSRWVLIGSISIAVLVLLKAKRKDLE